MNRKLVIFILIIGTLALAYLVMQGLIGLKQTPKKDLNRKSIPYVKVEEVKYRTITTPIEEKGRLISNLEVPVSSEVSGRIVTSDIPLKVGQDFKKGQVLVKIYDIDARMDLKAKKSNFLNKLAATLPDIKVDYADRFDTWMGFFNSISLEEELPELPELASPQEKIFMASRNILGDYYAIKSAEVRLAKYNIYAPFDGTFVEVNTQVGAVASPGARLASIIETKSLELQVPIEANEVKWLHEGDQVDILEEGDKICTGTLVRKSGFVDPGTQSISVFVRLQKNQGVELFQGQYLTARFPGKELSGVMEIPRNVVFRSNRVYIVENGKLRSKEIHVIKRNENTLVFNGLQEGEALVVEPLVKATENMTVNILK